MMSQSGLGIIKRKQSDTKDSLLKEIESHFGLSK